jgi:hypothetical protein
MKWRDFTLRSRTAALEDSTRVERAAAAERERSAQATQAAVAAELERLRRLPHGECQAALSEANAQVRDGERALALVLLCCCAAVCDV